MAIRKELNDWLQQNQTVAVKKREFFLLYTLYLYLKDGNVLDANRTAVKLKKYYELHPTKDED